MRLNFYIGVYKMWFKQLTAWRLPDISKISNIGLLNNCLHECRHKPITEMCWNSIGFIPMLNSSSNTDTYALKVQDTVRICLKIEEKVLTSSMIRGVVDEKIAFIAQQEDRKVGRKEKAEIKEATIDELLPRALTKISTIEAVIDLKNRLLFVNNATSSKAEIVLNCLREALGGLAANRLLVNTPLTRIMTDWLLAGHVPHSFIFDSDCELKGVGDSAPTIRASNQILTDDEIINHARDGKTVTQLGLQWRDNVKFILSQDFTLKRIQFLDSIQEDAAQDADNFEQARNASQILMTDALSTLINEIAEIAGGWLENQKDEFTGQLFS